MNTAIPKSFRGIAHNQVPNSPNKIHGDEIAKQYGFKGGLVPGVTLSAYLVEPALRAWGREWLRLGNAHITVYSPVYHDDAFEVVVQTNNKAYSAKLISGEKVCAAAEVRLPMNVSALSARSANTLQKNSLPLIDDNYVPQTATREVMENLQAIGCRPMQFDWQPEHEMATYYSNPNLMPALIQPGDKKDSDGGFANLSFLLGCANRHFASVAAMSPWVHLESRSQQFQPVPMCTQLTSHMSVMDLFNKKGHEFADCQFNLVSNTSGGCVFSVWQRAIYKMRGT